MSDRDGDWTSTCWDTAGTLHNLTAASAAHEYFPSFTFDGEQISLFSITSGECPGACQRDGTGFETQRMLDAMLDRAGRRADDWDPLEPRW